ncbi:MAG: zeta toxin family protein [Microbacterium sp.]
MTNWTLSEYERRQIFDERISRVVFRHAPSDDSAEMLFVVGQPGAGALRTTASLIDDRQIAVLSANDLRPFHPRFLELSRSRSQEAIGILTDSATGWMRSALQHARTTRRSLLLDGTLSSPDIALATTSLFERSGFTTSVVVVAVPRAESLLATASKYFLDARSGGASPFTTVAVHDAGFESTRTLVHTLESTPSVDRLMIVGRDGTIRFDRTRSDVSSFAGAIAALDREHVTALPGPQAMRWLSELRAITDFALSSRELRQPLAEVLVELHEVALREIVPRLPLPRDSQARPTAEGQLGRQLVAIRQTARVGPHSEPQRAPAVSVPEPDRGISI